MSTVGSVYCIGRYERTADDVLNSLRTKKGTQPDRAERDRPKPQFKQVFASVERKLEEVILMGFEEARKRDPHHRMECVVLVDGDHKQLRAIEAAAKKYDRKVRIIVDFIHLSEYIWKAAHALFGSKNTKEKEAWVLKRLERILEGHAGNVAAGVGRSAKRQGLTQKERAAVESCKRYILNHKKYMDYHKALQLGSPICTGVIEGACRYLVRDRMELTGCRWGLKGAEAMLKMRAIIVTGDFEEYWGYHLMKEKERNHENHYKDWKLPGLSDTDQRPQLTLIQGGLHPCP